jgi:hypothetical protein
MRHFVEPVCMELVSHLGMMGLEAFSVPGIPDLASSP